MVPHIFYSIVLGLIGLAGLPMQIISEGMSLYTELLVPTTAPHLISTPGPTKTSLANHTSSFIRIGYSQYQMLLWKNYVFQYINTNFG